MTNFKPGPSGWDKMQSTNPNAHAYVNGTDVETHGFAVMLLHLSTVIIPVHRRLWNMEGGVLSVGVSSVMCKVWSVERRV